MSASKLLAVAELAGSFALGGLIATDLGAQYDGEHKRLSLASLLLPSTSHAYSLFRQPNSFDTETLPRLKGFYALDETGRYTKVYPVELRIRSVYSQFSSSSLGTAAVRAVAFTYLPLVEGYFKQLKNAEDAASEEGKELEWDELPEFDWAQAQAKVPQALLAFAREIVLGLVRIALTRLAVHYLESRLVWKMVKDQMPSLRAKRGKPFYQRPFLVTRTVLRSTVIQTVAEVLVASGLEAARVYLSQHIPKEKKWTVLANRLAIIPLRSIVCLVAGSAAAGVVGTVRPGVVCLLATVAAGFAADVYVCLPAIQEYESRRRMSMQTYLILAGSVGVVALCFLPWIVPSYSTNPGYTADSRLALS